MKSDCITMQARVPHLYFGHPSAAPGSGEGTDALRPIVTRALNPHICICGPAAGLLMVSISPDMRLNQPGCSGYEGLIRLPGYALMGGGAVVAASTAVDGGSGAADCRAYLVSGEEVLQRRAFTRRYHGCPVAKSLKMKRLQMILIRLRISDGLTHPHAPIQDDASEPTPILPIKRKPRTAQTPAERDGGNRPFLVQSSCTGSLRYQDPLLCEDL